MSLAPPMRPPAAPGPPCPLPEHQDAGVRAALARMGEGDAVGFIEKDRVGLSYMKEVPDEATLRRHLDLLLATAAALRSALWAALQARNTGRVR